MPRTSKPKHYDYYCCARTGGAFAIVDFRSMTWCYMYRNDVKANKSKIMFSEKKETFMRPFFCKVVQGIFQAPSSYFYRDTPMYGNGMQLRNNITNRLEDLWAVPFDTFLDACGTDPELTSLLVLYGAEALYDKIITSFVNNRVINCWNQWTPIG